MGFSVELGPWAHRNQNMHYFDLGSSAAAEQKNSKPASAEPHELHRMHYNQFKAIAESEKI